MEEEEEEEEEEKEQKMPGARRFDAAKTTTRLMGSMKTQGTTQMMGAVDESVSDIDGDFDERRKEKFEKATASAMVLNDEVIALLKKYKTTQEGEIQIAAQIEAEVEIIDENEDVIDEDEDEDGELVVEIPDEAIPKGARKTSPEAVSPAAVGGKEGVKVFKAAFEYVKEYKEKISVAMIENDFFRGTDTEPIFDAEEFGKVSLFEYELNPDSGTIVGRGAVMRTVDDEVVEKLREEISGGKTVVSVTVLVCVQQLVPEGNSLCRNRAGSAAYAGSTAQGIEAMSRTFIDALGGTRNLNPTGVKANKLLVLAINMFADASPKRRHRGEEAKDRLEAEEHYESLKGANPTFCDLNAPRTKECLKAMFEIFARITEEVREYVSSFQYFLATAKGAKAMYDAVVGNDALLPSQFEETFPLWMHALHPSTLGRHFCMCNFAMWLIAMLRRFVPGFAIDDDGPLSRVQTFSGNRKLPAQSSAPVAREERFTMPRRISLQKVSRPAVGSPRYVEAMFPQQYQFIVTYAQWWLWHRKQKEENGNELGYIMVSITETEKELEELKKKLSGPFNRFPDALKKSTYTLIHGAGGGGSAGIGSDPCLTEMMNDSILQANPSFTVTTGNPLVTNQNIHLIKQKISESEKLTSAAESPLQNDVLIGKKKYTLWISEQNDKSTLLALAKVRHDEWEAKRGVYEKSAPKAPKVLATRLTPIDEEQMWAILNGIKGHIYANGEIKEASWEEVIRTNPCLQDRRADTIRKKFQKEISKEDSDIRRDWSSELADAIVEEKILQEKRKAGKSKRTEYTLDEIRELLNGVIKYGKNFSVIWEHSKFLRNSRRKDNINQKFYALIDKPRETLLKLYGEDIAGLVKEAKQKMSKESRETRK